MPIEIGVSVAASGSLTFHRYRRKDLQSSTLWRLQRQRFGAGNPRFLRLAWWLLSACASRKLESARSEWNMNYIATSLWPIVTWSFAGVGAATGLAGFADWLRGPEINEGSWLILAIA